MERERHAIAPCLLAKDVKDGRVSGYGEWINFDERVGWDGQHLKMFLIPCIGDVTILTERIIHMIQKPCTNRMVNVVRSMG
jgi:hypothetical protein